MGHQFKASIVRILNRKGDAIGAGFLASKRRVFTCSHVVSQALQIPKDTLQAPSEEVHVTACADGKARSADGKARSHDSKNYQEIVQKRHEEGVNAIAISPKEDYAAALSGDGRAKVWNVSNGEDI